MTNLRDLNDLVSTFKKAKVLCIGDIMLDRFIYGSVNRISPEAPIPILHIERETNMLGGAGNVVRNVAALGGNPSLVAVIGDDSAGVDIRSLLASDNVSSTSLVTDKYRPTGIKTRYLADAQQMLRTDQETMQPLSKGSAKKVFNAAKRAMKNCNTIVMSDYGKGVLEAKIVADIINAARVQDCFVVVDPKGRDYRRYQHANLVTPNQTELAEVIGHPIKTESEIVDAAKSLVKNHDLGAILVTRSQDGMTLVTSNGYVTHLPAEAREVFDVSGAGDTVAATLATAVSAGASILNSATLANIAAGIVVGKVGTAAVYSGDLSFSLDHQGNNGSGTKLLDSDQLLNWVQRWRRRGLKVGFTNGCFDLLHPGHISLLSQAKNACDRLIVGLNSDTSVQHIKGSNRPIQSETARSTVLTSMEQIDAVVIFDEDTPINLIQTIKPDVLIKGADYKVSQVVGANVVQEYGGNVVLIDLEDGHSTTRTISRIGK